MVPTRPLISKSSTSCTNLWATVPSAPITIGITVTFMFHSFFSSLARFRYLFLFSLSFSFTLWSTRTAKSVIRQVYFFPPLFLLSLGLVIWPILGDPLVSQNPREVRASHSPGGILDCAYTTCSYGVIKNFGTTPNWLPSPPSRILSYIIIIIIKFLTSALAGGLSLESKWQQVSSNPQDSSQYSSRFQ